MVFCLHFCSFVSDKSLRVYTAVGTQPMKRDGRKKKTLAKKRPYRLHFPGDEIPPKMEAQKGKIGRPRLQYMRPGYYFCQILVCYTSL